MREIRNPGELEPGDVVDGWRVVERLGAGGYGDVFLVEREGERLAMKFARYRRADGAEAGQTETRAWKEIVCLMQLDAQPHIRKVQGFGRWPRMGSGWLYLLLEYVEGDTLERWARRTKATAREAARLFAKVAAALEQAHRHGLYNRDLKPANILVRAGDGEPVVSDWGAGQYAMARELTEGPVPPGTWRYRSPEARDFERAHRNTAGAHYAFKPTDDLYSLGVTMYEVLTGRELEAGVALLPAETVNPNVPPVLSDVVRRLMAQQPKHRHLTAEALRRDLHQVAEAGGPEWDVPLLAPSAPTDSLAPGRPRGSRSRPLRWKLGAAGLAGAVALAAGVVLWSSRQHPVSAPTSAPVAQSPAPRPEAPQPSIPADVSAGLSEAASPATSPVQKESPSVKHTSPKQGRPVPASSEAPKKPASRAEFLALCRTLAGSLVAMQMGCAGAQLKPDAGECPREAVEAMNGPLRLHVPNKWLTLTWDKNQPRSDIEAGVYREGPITGLVLEGGGKLIEGTTLRGRVWLVSGWVLTRYDEATLPNGDKYPVCIRGGADSVGAPAGKGPSPDTYEARRSGPAWAVEKWPDDRKRAEESPITLK
jgi:serine/threonine-protein kinase